MATATDRSTGSGTDRLGEAAANVASEASETMGQTASRTMDQGADALDQLALAMRDACSGLRTEQPQLATVIETVVEQVDKASGYLRSHRADDVLDDMNDLARQQPALVVAGGLLAGLVLGRMLRGAGEASTNGWSDGNGSSGWSRTGSRTVGVRSWAGGTVPSHPSWERTTTGGDTSRTRSSVGGATSTATDTGATAYGDSTLADASSRTDEG